LRLADTAEPVPGADVPLVAIRAVALNVGEVTGLAERKQPGDVLGWTRSSRPASPRSGAELRTRHALPRPEPDLMLICFYAHHD